MLPAEPGLNTAQAVTLRPLYYLDNFHDLLSCVEKQYADLLAPAELDFLRNYKSLTASHQAFLVRLYSRRGSLFRSDRTLYPELPAPEALLAELEQKDFLQSNPEPDTANLLSLPTCREMKKWWPTRLNSLPASARRMQLVAALSVMDNADYYQSIPFTVILLNHKAFIELLLLLYFGHPHQNLTSYVTAELGHVRYESYDLDARHRLFSCRNDIDNALLLMHLGKTFKEAASFDEELGLSLLTQFPDIAPENPLRTRHDRLCNRVGRALERSQAYATALACYRKSLLPPSRERQARIHFRQANFTTAAGLCDAILRQPKSEAERCFAAQFKSRCQKKSGLKVPPQKRFQPETTELTLTNEGNSVEELVSSRITSTVGGDCYFVENWLFNACFGLTFWEAIFKSVRGAFTQPFQRRPHDLYDPLFSRLRMAEIERALALIHRPAWQSQLQQRWTDKFGISNPFVGWDEEGWPVLSQAIARIPPDHWQFIFSRMLADLRENCAGFPDLIHFPKDDGYRLLEVKSPTDKIQPNQARWMQAFKKQQIPCALIQVHWQDN